MGLLLKTNQRHTATYWCGGAVPSSGVGFWFLFSCDAFKCITKLLADSGSAALGLRANLSILHLLVSNMFLQPLIIS